MVLTVYCWLLHLYPESYRHEFAEEMTSIFRDSRCVLPPALAAKVSFYRREFWGLLSGALYAHLDRLFGPAIPLRRSSMEPQCRFPRTTVFLMLVTLAGSVLAIRMASSVAGDTLGSVWPSLVSLLVIIVLTTCTAATLVCAILHTLGRSGIHRLEYLQRAESNGKR